MNMDIMQSSRELDAMVHERIMQKKLCQKFRGTGKIENRDGTVSEFCIDCGDPFGYHNRYPAYTSFVAADYSVHQIACKWILSKRSAYLKELDNIFQSRAHHLGLDAKLKVAYPDVLRFYEVGDYSRAALKAIEVSP